MPKRERDRVFELRSARFLPPFEHRDRIAVDQMLDVDPHTFEPPSRRIGVQLGRIDDLVAERAQPRRFCMKCWEVQVRSPVIGPAT